MEMKRVLRPGGRLVVAMLNSRSPWAFFRRVKGLFRNSVYKSAEFISPRVLERELMKAGFKDIESKTCLFFLPIDSKIYIALAGMEERLGRRLFPEIGAFLVAVGTKA